MKDSSWNALQSAMRRYGFGRFEDMLSDSVTDIRRRAGEISESEVIRVRVDPDARDLVTTRVFTEPQREEPSMLDCCDDPQPRIASKTGRLFCGACRKYLDMPARAVPSQRSDEEMIDAMNDASLGDTTSPAVLDVQGDNDHDTD